MFLPTIFESTIDITRAFTNGKPLSHVINQISRGKHTYFYIINTHLWSKIYDLYEIVLSFCVYLVFHFTFSIAALMLCTIVLYVYIFLSYLFCIYMHMQGNMYATSVRLQTVTIQVSLFVYKLRQIIVISFIFSK